MSAPTFTSGCGFLSTEDLQSAIEARLPAERQTAFEKHLEKGCAPCLTLAADLKVFRRVLSEGLLETEHGEADTLAEPMRSMLREEMRRRRTPR